MARSIKACMNCGETREVAGHGLCFKCYRQEDRKLANDLWARPDAKAKDLIKGQRKTRKALMKMMDALEEIETAKLVPQATVEGWRMLLQPEVERIARSLGPMSGADANAENENLAELLAELAALRGVNTEDKDESELTTEEDEPSEQVNSEQQTGSEQFTKPADPVNVNSEPEKVSEQFTQPAEPVNQTNRTDQFAGEPQGLGKSPVLPPVVPQRITKVKEEKVKSHAA